MCFFDWLLRYACLITQFKRRRLRKRMRNQFTCALSENHYFHICRIQACVYVYFRSFGIQGKTIIISITDWFMFLRQEVPETVAALLRSVLFQMISTICHPFLNSRRDWTTAPSSLICSNSHSIPHCNCLQSVAHSLLTCELKVARR